MTWTSLKLIQWTSEYFGKKAIPNPRLDAELLLAHVLGCQRIDLYVHHERTVTEKHLATYHALIERRAKREPLQYIIGETEFWGLKIKVTPEVLIPRPETELLVETCVTIFESREDGLSDTERRPHSLAVRPLSASSRRLSPEGSCETSFRKLSSNPSSLLSILDIGTGSGCIAIALAKQFPNAKIIATDTSKEALAIARENAEANGVADRIEFLLSDIAPWKSFQTTPNRADKPQSGVEGEAPTALPVEGATRAPMIDLIVSNPPYIPTAELDGLQPEVSQFEPRSALDGGVDGLKVIRKILEEAPPFLKPNSLLIFEMGESQDAWLKETAFTGLIFQEIRKDYQDIPRIAVFKKA